MELPDDFQEFLNEEGNEIKSVLSRLGKTTNPRNEPDYNTVVNILYRCYLTFKKQTN